MQYVFEKLPKTTTAILPGCLAQDRRNRRAGLVACGSRAARRPRPRAATGRAGARSRAGDPAPRRSRPSRAGSTATCREQPRARRDGGLESLEIDDVALADEDMRDLDRRRVREPDDGGAVRPGRREAERLVARVEQQRMPRCSACTPEAVTTISEPGSSSTSCRRAVLTGERLAERRQSRVLRVVRVPVGERPRGRILDERGRRQGRLAEVEPQHVRHGHGHLGDLADPRVRDAQDGLGDTGHAGSVGAEPPGNETRRKLPLCRRRARGARARALPRAARRAPVLRPAAAGSRRPGPRRPATRRTRAA